MKSPIGIVAVALAVIAIGGALSELLGWVAPGALFPWVWIFVAGASLYGLGPLILRSVNSVEVLGIKLELERKIEANAHEIRSLSASVVQSNRVLQHLESRIGLQSHVHVTQGLSGDTLLELLRPRLEAERTDVPTVQTPINSKDIPSWKSDYLPRRGK